MAMAPNYCASKHGVVGFSRSMTVSCHGRATHAASRTVVVNFMLQGCFEEEGVWVCCVCPQYTDTAMLRGSSRGGLAGQVGDGDGMLRSVISTPHSQSRTLPTHTRPSEITVNVHIYTYCTMSFPQARAGGEGSAAVGQR